MLTESGRSHSEKLLELLGRDRSTHLVELEFLVLVYIQDRVFEEKPNEVPVAGIIEGSATLPCIGLCRMLDEKLLLVMIDKTRDVALVNGRGLEVLVVPVTYCKYFISFFQRILSLRIITQYISLVISPIL